MAVAVDEGDFRSLYGPKVVYGPDRPEEILALLRGVDAGLRARLAPGRQLKIMLYAHGGRVSHDDAVTSAQTIAPGALADGYAPIFLIWNSDMWDSYGQRLCCVLDGRKSRRGAPYFVPTRLAGDIGAGVARAPEHWGAQVLRFWDSVVRTGGTAYYLSPDDPSRLDDLFWGGGQAHVFYPALEDGPPRPGWSDILNAADRPVAEHAPVYQLLFPVRLATTGLSEVGAADWDDMVRRTRLAVQPTLTVITPAPAAAEPRLAEERPPEDPCEARTREALSGIARLAMKAKSASGEALRIEHEGGFAIFMLHLACEIHRGFGVEGVTADDIQLDFYGHSMGAFVGDEIISAHPDLPWRRIVYMAAADSLRDARVYLAPLLACAGTGPRDHCLGGEAHFWGLMLHPLAESHDLEASPALPEGSLLEWIDELFAGPVSIDDRRFGKWTNVEEGLAFFGRDARARMYFRVFPAQDKLRGSKYPDERDLYARQCGAAPGGVNPAPPRCHPIVHGEFTNYSFWRDKFLCDGGEHGADGDDCASDPRP